MAVSRKPGTSSALIPWRMWSNASTPKMKAARAAPTSSSTSIRCTLKRGETNRLPPLSQRMRTRRSCQSGRTRGRSGQTERWDSCCTRAAWSRSRSTWANSSVSCSMRRTGRCCRCRRSLLSWSHTSSGTRCSATWNSPSTDHSRLSAYVSGTACSTPSR